MSKKRFFFLKQNSYKTVESMPKTTLDLSKILYVELIDLMTF